MGDRTTPRLALADDHTDVLDEIRLLLEPEFQVVCSANQGKALVRCVDQCRPDGVVTDVNMPELNGIDAGREILGQGFCTAIVMLSMHNEPQLIQNAMAAGIRGYVLKEDAGEELIPALRAVLAGGRYLSRHVKASHLE
jgi:DNA-binding NarL/FixJ family response regulator